MNYVYSVNQTIETRYPYSSTTGTCIAANVASPAGKAVKLASSTTTLARYSESTIMTSVAKAPVVFYFMVDSSFQLYRGGIYAPTTCTTRINHAMVIVGYNTTEKSWRIRNSWGPYWGESGNARIKMTGNGYGPCGMYQYLYQPSLRFTSVPLS
jgi:C1A family cysteine protease